MSQLQLTRELLDERTDHYLQASSPYELCGKVIVRWEQDYGAGTTLVPDTLALLWAARGGLSEAELLDSLRQDGKPMPRAAWSPLFLAMSEALVSRGGTPSPGYAGDAAVRLDNVIRVAVDPLLEGETIAARFAAGHHDLLQCRLDLQVLLQCVRLAGANRLHESRTCVQSLA